MENYHVVDLIGEGSFGKVRFLQDTNRVSSRSGPPAADPTIHLLSMRYGRSTRAGENALARSQP